MSRHIAHRLLIGLCLLQAVPADPATILAGPTASMAEVDAIREATQEYEAFEMSFSYVSACGLLDLYFRSTATPVPNRVMQPRMRRTSLRASGEE